MFLPVLLVRDYGPWGFLVFAVPNVLGAAGMGWVLRRPGASERVLARNLPTCVLFSHITLAFQWFFAGWLLSSVGPAGGGLGALMLVVVALTLRGGRLGIVFAVSVLTLALSAAFAGALGKLGHLSLPAALGRPPADLIWLGPVCVLGFGLCPYLDMTFHRARRMCPGSAGTVAFTLGFCVLFAGLIVFTLGYRELLSRFEPIRSLGELSTNPAAILYAYLFLQLAFTIGVHDTEIEALRGALAYRRGRPIPAKRRLAMLAVFMAVPVAAGFFGAWAPPARGLAFNELLYRCFMSFYGLYFPAYVWLCMIPTRDGHSGVNPEKLRVWAAAVGIATPMFWMGFIEHQTWWLAPGTAVVLSARLLLPRENRRSTSARPAPNTA
jgi:hypothetical protein